MADHYKELATFKAAEDSRRLTLPPSADAYEIKTSQNFQPPQGVEFKLNPNDPMTGQAKAWAHKHGISQDALNEFVDVYAAGQIANTQMLKTARDAEVGKLGAAGPARVTAAQQFLNAQLGEELGNHFGTMLVTAKQVEAVEKLIAVFRGQGAGSFAPSRGPSEVENGKIAGYEKMTFEQRRFAQDQNAQRRAN